MPKLLSFVIPCYNSAATIAEVTHELTSTVEADDRYDFEVILVNDNAPDETWQVIEGLCDEDAHVRGASMMRNFGQHAALMAGYRASRGDIVVSLDDDGQTPPDQAMRLVDAIESGDDLVYCVYDGEQFSSGFRAFGSNVNDHMAHWLLGKPKGLYLSSYFAATRLVVDQVVAYDGPYPYVDGLFLRSAGRIGTVHVTHRDRETGQSGYSLHKLLKLWLNGFTAFSVKPLRVATIAGGTFALIGFVFAIVVVVQKLILRSGIDAGWSSLICVLLVMGGLTMMMLGLVGEYVGRTFVSLNGAPQYIVRERRNLPGGTDRPER